MANVKKYNLIDFYFHNPFLSDIIVIVLSLLMNGLCVIVFSKLHIPLIEEIDKTSAITFIATLCSISVTLAGFIIAALTILITVKSSLTARGFEDATNALEYVLSTKHYKNIIQVFINSIVELVALFVLLVSFWLILKSVNSNVIAKTLFALTYGIIAAIFRSLYILFSVLRLENLKRT